MKAYDSMSYLIWWTTRKSEHGKNKVGKKQERCQNTFRLPALRTASQPTVQLLKKSRHFYGATRVPNSTLERNGMQDSDDRHRENIGHIAISSVPRFRSSFRLAAQAQGNVCGGLYQCTQPSRCNSTGEQTTHRQRSAELPPLVVPSDKRRRRISLGKNILNIRIIAKFSI